MLNYHTTPQISAVQHYGSHITSLGGYSLWGDCIPSDGHSGTQTPLSHPLLPPSPFDSSPSQDHSLFQWLFVSDGQNIGVSASVFPMNIQGYFPFGLNGWISLQSKGFSRVFSSTTVWKNQFFGTQLSLQCNSHIRIWLLENHSFDYMDLCWQIDASAL